jgi:hypothetical protein
MRKVSNGLILSKAELKIEIGIETLRTIYSDLCNIREISVSSSFLFKCFHHF